MSPASRSLSLSLSLSLFLCRLLSSPDSRITPLWIIWMVHSHLHESGHGYHAADGTDTKFQSILKAFSLPSLLSPSLAPQLCPHYPSICNPRASRETDRSSRFGVRETKLGRLGDPTQ
ncbi:uncharacterized protein BO72DRAFT_443801 [Aspergillus fijiensis CBS 313.89]|uniref:Secreted protein n=1 Tax=Aspergillus fijiensis CBS 313.89 TaxID=1448319 RepID=A0A8G1W435_9EURO|nr:uncharacterized protein BO72DRAFT_443801 [Aspergillus fijiensis CBS 313.89]RAK82353.1 hypothetical protein BO72DRAFT_443801 [Aspergillus fijiensis CBS 313.89]